MGSAGNRCVFTPGELLSGTVAFTCFRQTWDTEVTPAMKNICVIHHEELDLFLVTKGLQELFVQLKVRSVLTYLDICNLMDVPLWKITEKKISNLEAK